MRTSSYAKGDPRRLATGWLSRWPGGGSGGWFGSADDGGPATPSPGKGRPTEVHDRPDEAREHDDDHPDELVPHREHRLVRYFDHIDEAQIQTMMAASARTTMMTTGTRLMTRSSCCGMPRRRIPYRPMIEQRSYRTERERALRASILGALLGVLLALSSRGRRTS